MDALQMIKERRSVRKFTDQKVDKDTIKEIVSLATYAPTWANSQTARYTVIEDRAVIDKLANDAMGSFPFNVKTATRAAGVVVVSAVKGLSGRSPQGEISTKKGDAWEMFDAGTACQTFCLAAYEKGVGTVILGIFDEDKVAEIAKLPENEVVTAIIPYGYEVEHKPAPKRLDVDEITRFI